jgi:hypothetical protein
MDINVTEDKNSQLFTVVINGEPLGFFFLHTSGRYRIPEQRGKGYATEEEAILGLIGRKMKIKKVEVN